MRSDTLIAISLTVLIMIGIRPAFANSPIAGLDHVVVLAEDLDAVTQAMRNLGFTVKPGHLSNNGMRDRHIRFANGSELELVSVDEGHDALSRDYARLLDETQGPAFFGLYAPDLDAVAMRFDAVNKAYQRREHQLNFGVGDSLHHVFIGQRVGSPTDTADQFVHANGALALTAVWLSGEDLSAEADLVKLLGAPIETTERCLPDCLPYKVATLGSAELIFMPAHHQWHEKRHIIGVTIRIKDMAQVLKRINVKNLKLNPVEEYTGHLSLFLPPELSNGLWIELRQDL